MAQQPLLPALDLLLRQYWRYASDLVDVAAPQDNFVSRLSSDWRYERALQGVRLLAQHHIGVLVQNLMAWRQQVTDEIKKAYSGGPGGAGGSGVLNLQGICKRAAMEIIFLEASQVVLEEFRPEFFSDRLFCLFFDNMQQLAFRWLVKAEEYVPHAELTGLRSHLVANSARLVAAMSRIRLPDITQQARAFLRKLDERLNPRKDASSGGSPGAGGAPAPAGAAALRAQLLKLCSGMRGVVLGFDSDQQLAASTDFLRQAHPLNHTAANLPAANAARLSPQLLAEWYGQVLRVKNEIGQWVNKHNKHIHVGYPLVTLLVCLVEQEQYGKQMDIMAEFLVKQMKVKEFRALCFRCLGQLVFSYLVRVVGPAAPPPGHAAWLDRVVRPSLATARKGGLVAPQEQLEFVAELADLNPEYALGAVVLDMLQQSDAPETQTTALRALQVMLTSVPAARAAEALEAAGVPGAEAAGGGGGGAGRLRHSGGALLLGQQQAGRRMVQVSLQAALQLVRSGRHPFDLQGIPGLLPRVQSTLAALLGQCHSALGSATAWSGEAVPKDRAPTAALLGWLLRLLPLLRPEGWPGQPLDLLPGYTAHVEGQLRVCALDALQAVMRSAPALRGAALAGVARFLSSIPDEAATRECALLLRNLMQLWLNLLLEEGAGASLAERAAGAGGDVSGGDAAAAAAGAGELDLSRVEGPLLVLLCSFDAALRRDALDGLAQARALHQQLARRAAGGGGGGGAGPAVAVALLDGDGGGGTRAGARLAPGHDALASRDSIDFVRALGSLDAQRAAPEATTYLMDVLEEVGGDAARRCYWDFGDWSDVWRDARPAPPDVGLESLMPASDDVGCLRWARVTIEIVRAAAAMCPATAGAACALALAKLQRHITRDASGRAALPAEQQEARGAETWRACLALPCVVPPALVESASASSAPRKGAGLAPRDVLRALLAALSAGVPPMHQQLYLLAVGHCSREHYPLVAQELSALIDEYQRPSSKSQRARSAGRPEEARKLVANILRALADAAPPGAAAAHPAVASRYSDWLRDTAAFLRGLPAFGEDFWEASQVAYCLCSVVRCLGGQLAPQPPPAAAAPQPPGPADGGGGGGAPALAAAASSVSLGASAVGSSKPGDLPTGGANGGGGGGGGGAAASCAERKALWELLAAWCQDGKPPESSEYASRLSAGVSQALARLRDLDAEGRDAVRAELLQCAEALDAAARAGMAELLQGPAFDTDARRAQGPVLQWADRLLRAPPPDAAAAPPGAAAGRLALLRGDADGGKGGGGGGGGGGAAGPPRAHVARLALGHLLRFNLDMFSVVSEVYALHLVPCEPHVVLSLVLYKMVDPGPEGGGGGGAAAGALVAAAGAFQGQLSLEQLLEGWEDALRGGSSSVVVLGALQDSYQQFQYQLSAKLARDHPELSEQLCEEMMTRQLECADKNLSIAAHWKGTWCERLLKSMYYVTLRHGSELPLEIERLWSTLAGNRRNIIPVLDFLVSLGMHVAFQELPAVLEYFSVAQRICLYLARISPQQTIDHLVCEVSLGLHEDYALTATDSFFIAAGSASGRLERADSAGALASSQRRQSGPRPSGPLEFASLLAEPGPPSGSGHARAPSSLNAPAGRLAASVELRYSTSSSTWAPGCGAPGGGGGSLQAAAALGRASVGAGDEGGSMLSHSVATQRSDSATSRSSGAFAAGALSGGGGGGDPTASGGGWAAGLGRDAASVASWDDASSIGLPMPPAGGGGGAPPRGGGGSRGAGGGGGGGGAPRGASGESASPAIRALVTRPELALCLLTEVAYEHDEDFEGHLALLLHVVVLSMDSDEPLVAGAAQVTQLIQYLQSLRGRRLWPNEDPTLPRPSPDSAAALGSLVGRLLGALGFEPGLRGAWCDTALEWALHCRSRHMASRSQQVLRTLAPPLTADLVGALLRCVLQCTEPAAQASGRARAHGVFPAPSAVARETALELVVTLTALVAALPPGRLLLFPQARPRPRPRARLRRLLLGAPSPRRRDATVQSVLLAAAPIPSPEAAAAAGGGADGGGGLRRSSSCDVGAAVDGPVGPPAPWGVGQLLPWREGTQAAQVLSVQQLLWKGLLFADSRGAAVRLMTQLAAQLSHLHAGGSRGGSPSLSWSGGALAARGAATPPRPPTPGGGRAGGGGAAAAAPQARGSRGHHSRASSTRSSGTGLPGGGAAADGGGSRVPSSTPGSSAAPGGPPSLASPSAYGLQPGQASLPPLHEQPDGAGGGGPPSSGGAGSGDVGAGTPVAHELHGVLSRSAPELGNLGARPAGDGGGAGGAPAGGPAPPPGAQAAAAAGPGGGGGGGGGAGELDRDANFRTAPLPRRARAALPPPAAWPGGGAGGAPAPRQGGGSPAPPRRQPGVRRVYQALFGHRHAQIAVTAAALVPLALSQLRAPPPGGAGAAVAAAAAGELRDALLTLAAACGAQGLRELGSRLEALAAARRRDVAPLLPRLASALARAFCPAYAPWLLRAAGGALLLPGAAALHAPVLDLLRCVFAAPGLELGSDALALVVGDGGLLGPVVALSQGPLCHQALAALNAITSFVASCPDAAGLQQRQRQQAAAVAAGQDAGGGGGGGGGAPQGSEPRAAVAAVLPQLDVAAALQRVVDGCAPPPKKRKLRPLPFVVVGGGGDAARRFGED
ncbi:MAG: cell morphogenesis central region-domain-containing protein [Monoraphidium minutum]|nr:MAG: cell morphogenesis central region-domain-containing protein [Monoraphidium minutum]